MRISDWSSDVCSSDLPHHHRHGAAGFGCFGRLAEIHVASTGAVPAGVAAGGEGRGSADQGAGCDNEREENTNAHTIDSLSRVVGGRDWKGNDGDSLRRDAAMQRPDTHPSPKLEPAVKADEPVVSRPAEDGLQLAGRYPAEDLPLQPV